MHGDKPDARSADLQLGCLLNRNIRLEAADVIQLETLAEEMFGKNSRSREFARHLLAIIAPGIETQLGVQIAKILVSANMVPVRMGNEDGCQFRQARRIRSE